MGLVSIMKDWIFSSYMSDLKFKSMLKFGLYKVLFLQLFGLMRINDHIFETVETEIIFKNETWLY